MQGATDRIDWRLFALFFAVVAALLVIRAMTGAATTPLLHDTDDAMRLTEVRDLIAGQDWYDQVQHRLDTPYGAPMHWSRLVDLPIAALLVVLQPFAGTATTTLAAYLYPLALLAGLLWLNVRLAMALGGSEAQLPGLALPAFSLVTLIDFAPGRFDHHSVQILLTLGLLLASIGALRRPRLALLAGGAAGAALAVGVESLPGAAGAILGFGLVWVLDARHASALRFFGLGFAASATGLLLLTVAPGLWLVAACDAISPVYAAAALGVGAAFTLLSLLRLATARARLLAGLVAGTALAGGLALLFPGCLGGPYAGLDPWLMTHWMNRIEEAQPFHSALLTNPAYSLAVGLPPFLALAVAGNRLLRHPADGRWLVYFVFLVFAVLVMLLQVRAARMAMCLSLPAGAALIVMARDAYRRRGGIGAILGLVGSWLGFTGLAIALGVTSLAGLVPQGGAVAAAAEPPTGATCRLATDLAGLAALPPQRVMAPIDLGAHILAYSAHSVVAAPYHRNQRGIRDSLEFFNGPIEAGRAILEERGITLVVACPGMPEMRVSPDTPADAFVRLMAEDRLPDWLERLSPPDAPLAIYAVR